MRLAWGLLVLVAACGDNEGYRGPTVRATGEVIEYRHVGYLPPIPGATICVYDQPSLDCAITDEHGNYELPRVPVGETALVFSAESYFNGVSTLTVTEDFWMGHRLLTHNDLLLLAGTAGVQLEPGKGIVTFDLMGAIGVTATLSPAGGVGPIYNDNSGIPDPTQIATTYAGRGEYANLDPGKYSITFHQLNTTFTTAFGWDLDGGARFPIVADALTGVVVSVK